MADGRIQRVPLGILSWLGLRNDGDQPRDFSGTVVPTTDMTAFYAALDQTQTIQTDAPTLAVGTGSIVTVPAGEAWLILAIGGLWSGFTAGSVFRACIELGQGANLVPVYTMDAAFTISAGATDVFRLPFVPPQPLILPGGGRIATTLLSTMANNATPQLRVLYVPMRV